MKTKPRIFISVPDDRHLDERRKELKRAIISFIAGQGYKVVGFEPEQWGPKRAPNLDVWTVKKANELIRQCDGVVVLALARRHVHSKGEETGSAFVLPTPYNHLEGGLAIAQQVPVFIVCEEQMDRTGILNCEITAASIPSKKGRSWINDKSFKMHFKKWAVKIRERRDVFLGYCSKADRTAVEIRNYLEGKGFSVLDWARDFRPAGVTILEEIEKAANCCRCAVFLFTKDDELEKNAQAKASSNAVPRDNVLLEARYFTQARGKARVAIVRQKGAKMPADLGGIIYLSLEKRSQLLTVKKGLVKFLIENV